MEKENKMRERYSEYQKATAEVIYFTNEDIITTSGAGGGIIGGGCSKPGHDRGNGCSGVSGACPGQAWK